MNFLNKLECLSLILASLIFVRDLEPHQRVENLKGPTIG
jgi:hypothetical protein